MAFVSFNNTFSFSNIPLWQGGGRGRTHEYGRGRGEPEEKLLNCALKDCFSVLFL